MCRKASAQASGLASDVFFMSLHANTPPHLQEYKEHERSREAIELAFDAILQQKMKTRHKYGFRPPRSGRKTDVAGDPVSYASLVAHKGY